MSFEKIIRIPKDRIGALIGKSGKIKSKIENSCSVKLEINSDNGEIEVIDAFLPKYKIIDSRQMLLAITGNFIIIDIRTPDQRQKTGIIPDSILLTVALSISIPGSSNTSLVDGSKT